MPKELYVTKALEVLKALRDDGPIRRNEFTSRLDVRNVDAQEMEALLMRYELAKPESGRNGLWKLID